MKITVVGAGAVGATCADDIARKALAEELILLDIKDGLAEGKSIDMMQTAALLGFDSKIKGVTNDYAATADSRVVVITSGIPRKPGMTREELIGTNASIVKSVTDNILKYSPNTIIIVVSNPMDTMNYLTLKASGLPQNQVIGMGGSLDSARFKYYLSKELNCSPADLNAVVIGGHGDTTMIPLIKHATWNSIPVTQFLSAEQQENIIKSTMTGGATLTKLIGTSAWYAPGAATASMVESIVRDQKKLISCGAALNGEYGQADISLVVPAVLGKNGIEKILELHLDEEDNAAFAKSADAVRSTNNVLKEIGVL